jgi:polyvinyl alcohol dehydrogenase (cytochrome)
MPSPVQARSTAPAALAAVVLAALTGVAAGRTGEIPIPPAATPDAPDGATANAPTLCADRAGGVALGSAQWNGWGRGVENTRYQPEPAIRATDVSRLALKWAFGYPGADTVSGQPTIVDGRVFVAASGQVYALDAKSGCTYWRYDLDGRAFSTLAIVELGAERPIAKPKKSKRGRIDAHLEVQKPPSAAFVGDDKGTIYALDAEHGTLLWKTQLDTQANALTLGAPAVYQNRIYVAVGSGERGAARNAMFRGSVAALDVATGRVVWKTYLVAGEPGPMSSGAAGAPPSGPAGVAVAGAPTLDTARGLAYVATGDSFNPALQPIADAVVALDLADGKVRWSRQLQPPAAEGVAGGSSPRAVSSSPILRTLTSGRQVLLAGQRSGMVYGLDPERSGELVWEFKASESSAAGGVESAMAADHHSVYAALSGMSAEPATASGSLVAIEMKSGAKRWETAAPAVACSWSGAPVCAHGQAQAVTVIPGAAFSGSMDGHLRAYSTIDGKILWDYDTAKDFPTVNRVNASGGSLDQGGATIVNGVVYVNSGSDRGRPGNVLLAFSVDGK